MRDLECWNAWNEDGGPDYPQEKVVQFVLRLFPREDRGQVRILDLGCGSGVHTLFLAAEGFATVARDLSPVGVRNTRSRLEARGLHGDVATGTVEQIDLPDGSCDAVISIGVMDSAGAGALAPALQEIVRVLKPAGVALLLFASDRDFRVTGENEYRLHGYTDAEVEAAVQQLGNLVEYCWMDRYITTYRGGRVEQNDHLLTVRKASA